MLQYIVKSTTSFDGILENGPTGTEYGDEYTSIDLVDETKQVAAHDETSNIGTWNERHIILRDMELVRDIKYRDMD